MQFKVIFALAFATLAVAVPSADSTAANPVKPPADAGSTIKASKCSSGHLQCCKSAVSPSSHDAADLIKSHGYSASDISGLVGLDCKALSDDTKPCDRAVRLCCTKNPDGKISLACNMVN